MKENNRHIRRLIHAIKAWRYCTCIESAQGLAYAVNDLEGHLAGMSDTEQQRAMQLLSTVVKPVGLEGRE